MHRPHRGPERVLGALVAVTFVVAAILITGVFLHGGFPGWFYWAFGANAALSVALQLMRFRARRRAADA